MFSSVSVNGYRGIKSVIVEDCRQVNVFFGRNNCGKSSLLESIFLLSGQSNPLLPFRVNSFRGYTTLESEADVKLNFYNLESENPIIIFSTGTHSRKLRISERHIDSKTIDVKSIVDINSKVNEQYYGLKFSFGENEFSEILYKEGTDSNAKVKMSKQYKESITAEILYPRFVVSEYVIDRLTKIITEKKKDKILSILQLVDRRISDIVVAKNTIMVDIGADHFLPINFMGDGMVRLLVNIITIYECADGIALIDEVDNGLHFSMMELLWKSMITAAKENNVQLFVSTHNIDSLKGLNKVMQSGTFGADLLSAYKLIKTPDDTLNALRYDAKTLDYMIKQEIEVR